MTREEFEKDQQEENLLIGRRQKVLIGVILALVLVLILAMNMDAMTYFFGQHDPTFTAPTAPTFITPFQVWIWVAGGIALVLVFMMTGKSHTDGGFLNTCSRILIFVAFHSALGYSLWAFADYFLFPTTGPEGFFKSLLDLTGILIIAKSIHNSFAMIPANSAGQVLYFQVEAFNNIRSGLVVLGLPKWFGTTLREVNAKEETLVIGKPLDKDGKTREEFIVEGYNLTALVKSSFKYKAVDVSRKYQIGANLESLLVAIVVSYIRKIINSVDEVKQKPLYPDVTTLKDHGTEIAEKACKAAAPEFRKLGFELSLVIISGIENKDHGVIDAAQALQARVYKEKEEMLDVKNVIEKARCLYNELNVDLKPGDKAFPLQECVKLVQAYEDKRSVTDLNIGGKGGKVLPVKPV